MTASPGPHPVYEMLHGQHYSKLTPLIYNLDRIPHTAGIRPAHRAKMFQMYIHAHLNIQGGGSLGHSLPKMPWLLPHNPAAHWSAGTCVHAIFGTHADLCAVWTCTSYHCSGFFSDRRDGENAVQCSIHIWLYLRGRNNHTTQKNSYIHPSWL